MVALFHHCCRTGLEEYWQPSCNWLFTCLVAEPGDGYLVEPLLQDRLGRILTTLLQLINNLPGNRTLRWLHCSAITADAGKFGKNIGNPLATD
jgi:hypothetical protein